MYAIVEVAGQQFKVESGKKIFVHRLEAEGGKKIDLDKVLLIDEDGKVTIGEPTIPGAVVEAEVLDHVRGDKVIVFKKKRKKGYRIRNGHRQNFTQLEIISINGKGTPRKETPKKEKVVAAEAVAEADTAKTKKATAKKAESKAKTAEKKADEKKAEKKPAAKKTSKAKEK
jgi:large subunit ribosomal protein L21